MRLDSCRQCIRRRIRCDATSPRCTKCSKKGIECSGVGVQYRFVKAVEKRAYIKPPTQSNLTSTSHHEQQGTTIIFDPSAAQSCSDSALNTNNSRFPHHSVQYGLESCSPQQRMLFDHFSSAIAPTMVVIDHRANGYRNIILPLALQDPLVRQTVLVVAALHLGRKQEKLLQAAEQGRSAIITRLRKDAIEGRYDKIFRLSTWATIILLLVGETVTGEGEFVHLFSMLQHFTKYSAHFPNTFSDEVRFLQQQNQMFRLFTPPVLGPSHGIPALQGRLDNQLDCLTKLELEAGQFVDDLLIFRKAISLTRDLYLYETGQILFLESRQRTTEILLQLLYQVHENTPSMHAFVWCYFIVGASTSNSQHRTFVMERLGQIFTKTGMRNILATIDLLESVIWHLPEGQSWTDCPSVLNRTLIM